MTQAPNWYQPDGDDADLLLSAVIDCGGWGRVTIEDPPEFKRRAVQKVQVSVAKRLGAKAGQVFDGVDKGEQALDGTAEMTAAKLAAYVTGWESAKIDPVPTTEDSWSAALEQIPGKVIDRIVDGIDLFSGAAGNAPSPSSGKSAATSSSGPKLLATGGTPSSSSTSSTGHAQGSSPAVEVSTTNPAG